jgi:hypothetical protein
MTIYVLTLFIAIITIKIKESRVISLESVQ